MASNPQTDFYFSLPRLVARWRGGSDTRSQNNWLEANVAGTAMHLIVYLFAARYLIAEQAPWAQLLLAIPLAFLVLLFWMLITYLNSFLVRGLRQVGIFRGLPDDRAQSILIGTMVTAMACQLAASAHWTRIPAAIWIILVACNLVAAFLLGIGHPGRVAAE